MLQHLVLYCILLYRIILNTFVISNKKTYNWSCDLKGRLDLDVKLWHDITILVRGEPVDLRWTSYDQADFTTEMFYCI